MLPRMKAMQSQKVSNQLLSHPEVNGDLPPASKGGAEHTSANAFAKNHTAFWRMRADYVLPSRKGFQILDSGVFWPGKRRADGGPGRESGSLVRITGWFG
jgi:hypothetical protein